MDTDISILRNVKLKEDIIMHLTVEARMKAAIDDSNIIVRTSLNIDISIFVESFGNDLRARVSNGSKMLLGIDQSRKYFVSDANNCFKSKTMFALSINSRFLKLSFLSFNRRFIDLRTNNE